MDILLNGILWAFFRRWYGDISALCFMDSISVLEPRGGSYFGLRPQSYADEKKL